MCRRNLIQICCRLVISLMNTILDGVVGIRANKSHYRCIILVQFSIDLKLTYYHAIMLNYATSAFYRESAECWRRIWLQCLLCNDNSLIFDCLLHVEHGYCRNNVGEYKSYSWRTRETFGLWFMVIFDQKFCLASHFVIFTFCFLSAISSNFIQYWELVMLILSVPL